MNYVVISCDRGQTPPKVTLDAAQADSADAALQQIAVLRKTADIVLALNPSQLRQYADAIEKLKPVEISLLQASLKKKPLA